jgi:hypothetical protein
MAPKSVRLPTPTKRNGKALKTGDTIEFVYMSKPAVGTIIEDRGNLGVGGRRLYRIEAQTGTVTRVLEVTADQLTKVPSPAKA